MMKRIAEAVEIIWGWMLFALFLIWLWATVSGGLVGFESAGAYGWEY